MKISPHLNQIARLKTLYIVLTLALVFALGFHGAIHHEHPEEAFGAGPQAAFHGENKKLWLLLGFFVTAFWTLKSRDDSRKRVVTTAANASYAQNIRPRITTLRMLREGVMHPKFFE